jgi:hypothetical protein
MVLVYNSRTVLDMDDEIKAQIEAAGVPLSVYTNNYTDLGPANKSAIKRFAIICDKVFKNDLPLPPSPFIEYVVDRTTGKSKQDFTGMIDGKKGMGKSTTNAYFLGRYAIEAAERFGQDPKDFFSLDNCALLEDTEGIVKILDEAEKYQGIMLDDASVALGSRDFATQKNKNLNKIMTVCRPMRWFVMQNAPMTSHIDLQQRELMDFVAHVYKSYHEGGFNIIKINSIDSTYRMGKKKVFEKRFSFCNKKIDFYAAYSPDILDPFKGFMEKYDKQREEASNRLISEISGQEKARSNPVTKQEQKRRELLETHGWTLKKMKEEGATVRQITGETGLSPHMQQILWSRLKKHD